MLLFNVSKLVTHWLADRLTASCKQRGLEPTPLVKGVRLWLGWTGLTWLAFLMSLLFIEVGERSDVSGIDGLLGGALIGTGQWLMLKAHVQGAYRWITVSALSWGALAFFRIGAIGWMASEAPFDTGGLFLRGVFGIFYGGYVGVFLGVGQWWVMRSHIVRAWRWIPLSAGIWAVAIALGWQIGGALRATSRLFVGEVVGLMVAWGAIALLSGMGIAGMVYQSRPKA